jgi:hypothetical protein
MIALAKEWYFTGPLLPHKSIWSRLEIQYSGRETWWEGNEVFSKAGSLRRWEDYHRFPSRERPLEGLRCVKELLQWAGGLCWQVFLV